MRNKTKLQLDDLTLVDLLDSSYHKYKNQTAFKCHNTSMTYSEFYTKAQSLAIYLREELKIHEGDRVAIMLPNLLQYPVAIFGVLLAGAVVVNLNPLDKAPSLSHEIITSDAKVIIALEHFMHELSIALSDLGDKKNVNNINILVTSIGDFYSPVRGFIYNFITRYIRRDVKRVNLDADFKQKILKFNIINKNKNKNIKLNIKPDDLAFLQFTGGTTGDPKAVMLTHSNIMSNLQQCYIWGKDVFTHESERVITPLPLYHIFALVINLLLFIKIGGVNILIPNPRDLNSFIKMIKHEKFNIITGVNTLYNSLLKCPKFKDCDFSELTLAIAGGMGVDKAVADKWLEVTGINLTQGYGLTETSPVISVCPPNDKFTGSCGKAVVNTEIKIYQDKKFGKFAKSDKFITGEILVKGPQVMAGYWHDPATTDIAIDKQGWLHTGDYGYMDKHGYLYILDRIKDIIIVSGFNVCSSEVEAVLLTMDGILEVAVVAQEDADHGQRVVAHVALEPNSRGHINNSDILSFARSKLAAYKAPDEIILHDKLPKSSVGKVLKKVLLG